MSSENETADEQPPEYKSGTGVRKKLGPFFGKQNVTRIFLRDQDDSSDEETLKKKTEPLDYKATFQKAFKKTDAALQTFWLVHILSNRLLYSKEVNAKYYTEKKPLLVKKTKLRLILSEIILNLVKDISQYLVDLPEKRPLSAAAVKSLEILALDEARKIIDDAIESYENFKIEVPADAFDELTKAITEILLRIDFQCFFDKTKYDYRTPEDPAKVSDQAQNKLELVASKKEKDAIVKKAVRSIKAELTPKSKSTAIDRSQSVPVFTQTSTLALHTWELVKSLPRIDVDSAKAELNRKSSWLFFQELATPERLPENQHTGANIWKRAINDEDSLWLIRYVKMTDARLRDLIAARMRQIGERKLLIYFRSSRPTLGNKYDFFSDNFVVFLSNLRLAHRSIRRELKNVTKNVFSTKLYTGNSQRTIHYHWNFFLGLNIDALETQSVNANTLLRSSIVDNASTYAEISSKIVILLNLLNAGEKKYNDKTIAILIRELLKGNIAEHIAIFPVDFQEVILERITALAYLLFGCEVARNPASLIIHHMMLDLVLCDPPNLQISFETLFAGNSPKMPMAAGGSIERGRAVNAYFTEIDGIIFPYKFDDSVKWTKTIHEKFPDLYSSECELIQQWLTLKKVKPGENLNTIAKVICGSFDEWFGKNVFKKNQFLLSGCDDEELSDDEQTSAKPGGGPHAPPQDRALPTLVFKVSNFIPVEPLAQLIQQKIDEKNNGDPAVRFLQITQINEFNKKTSGSLLVKKDKDQTEDEGKNKATTEVFVVQDLAALTSGQTLLIPINHNNLHFTLLAFRRTTTGDLRAVYVDSFGDFNGAFSYIKAFCETIDDAIVLEAYCEKYQANEDCAIHTEANAEVLLHLPDDKFSGPGLKEEVLRRQLNNPQIATQRRLEFAQRAQVLPGIEQIYSAVEIDAVLLDRGKRPGLAPQ